MLQATWLVTSIVVATGIIVIVVVVLEKTVLLFASCNKWHSPKQSFAYSIRVYSVAVVVVVTAITICCSDTITIGRSWYC